MADAFKEPRALKDESAKSETLRPEGTIGQRVYIVQITEVGERIAHKQEWASFYNADGSAAHGGYLTTAHREKSERVVFRGEFPEPPKISALAKLMEAGE